MCRAPTTPDQGRRALLHLHDNPSLTVAFALAAGMVGQALAHHLRLPGIVLLLAIGVALGPDGANVVQPKSLGGGLMVLVGVAVSIILFEGGLRLDIRRLMRERRAIRQLLTIGGAVSAALGAVLAASVLGWGWQLSLLFGTLVIVTGPTVVTPLLRRLQIKRPASTVLEAEGVLIDAIGAITAAVALEVVLQPTDRSLALGIPVIAGRLFFGVLIGLVGGGILALLLRVPRLVPEGLENVLTLSFAILVYALANALVEETGIAAVAIAGAVVGNTRARPGLAEFKEQLTVLLIGLLFVLLVADVRLADVMALGWGGAAVAAGCILLVRPLSVFAGTARTELTLKERVFIAWIGPRGIVAAAVASLFGYELDAMGIPGGTELRALVFLVIAATVLWSALTGGPIAKLLGLRRRSRAGWVVLGGNPLARRLARTLHQQNLEVLVIDSDPAGVRVAEELGFRAIHGNALEPRTLARAELDTRLGALAVTTKEEVNYIFAEKARAVARTLRTAVALRTLSHGVTPKMVEDLGAEVLFGASVDITLWSQRCERGKAKVEWWRFVGGRDRAPTFTEEERRAPYLPLLHRRKRRIEPCTSASEFKKRSWVAFLIDDEHRQLAETMLAKAGWERP